MRYFANSRANNLTTGVPFPVSETVSSPPRPEQIWGAKYVLVNICRELRQLECQSINLHLTGEVKTVWSFIFMSWCLSTVVVKMTLCEFLEPRSFSCG